MQRVTLGLPHPIAAAVRLMVGWTEVQWLWGKTRAWHGKIEKETLSAICEMGPYSAEA